MLIDIMKINIKIPHYTKLLNRMDLMKMEHEKIKNDKIIYDIKIMTDFDKEKITKELKDKYIFDDLSEWNKRLIVSEQKDTSYKRKLIDGEISLIIKSVNIWKNIIDENNEICFVVEDDVNFTDNFSNKLIDCMNNIPRDWDILYINLEYLNEDDKVEKNITSRKERVLYNSLKKIKTELTNILNKNKNLNKNKSNDFFTLITEGKKWFMGSGYVLKRETAKKFYDHILKKKIALPIDAEIGYLIEKMNLKCYWLNFNLIKHNFTIESALSHERYLARKGKLS